MEIVRSLDQEIWRQFVAQHPDGNIFHTPEMFQVFAQAKGHKPELWAAVDHKGQVLALLSPVRVTLMNGMMRYLTTRSVVYGGILSATGQAGTDALRLLLPTYVQKTKGTLFTELRHQADSASFQSILQDCNCKFEAHDNYLINLELPVGQVWGNISKSARKTIRKAKNKNLLAIEELRDCDKLSIWYKLIQKTYETSRIPLADYSLFETAFDILYPQKMIRFLLGRVEDKYIAASVSLLYNDTIYGWYRGFEREYKTYLPNDLMVWHLLKWGAENGYRIFDFGGAGKPGTTYGPRRFKAKFGGKLVSYGRNTCVHSPALLGLSQVGYNFYRRFFINRLQPETIGKSNE